MSSWVASTRSCSFEQILDFGMQCHGRIILPRRIYTGLMWWFCVACFIGTIDVHRRV